MMPEEATILPDYLSKRIRRLLKIYKNESCCWRFRNTRPNYPFCWRCTHRWYVPASLVCENDAETVWLPITVLSIGFHTIGTGRFGKFWKMLLTGLYRAKILGYTIADLALWRLRTWSFNQFDQSWKKCRIIVGWYWIIDPMLMQFILIVRNVRQNAKLPEVIDGWFDSGQYLYYIIILFRIRNCLKTFPADFISKQWTKPELVLYLNSSQYSGIWLFAIWKLYCNGARSWWTRS